MMKRINLFMATLIIIFLAVVIVDKIVIQNSSELDLTDKIYEFMKDSSNQQNVFNEAKGLNANSSSNACVYFVSEVLRENNVQISKDVANTAQLISTLKQKGWKKDIDYMDLERGDIVFTTDETGDKNGVPSHVFVFMGWVNEGSYDYAYICDNQAKDYLNKIYHIRNIKNKAIVNGITKDAFSFFYSPE